jgi:hypothetical protein
VANKDINEVIETLQRCLDIQCQDGNWNYDPYLHGMANGMIFAMSLLTDKDPEFLDAPSVFLSDLETLDKLQKSGIIVNPKEDSK